MVVRVCGGGAVAVPSSLPRGDECTAARGDREGEGDPTTRTHRTVEQKIHRHETPHTPTDKVGERIEDLLLFLFDCSIVFCLIMFCLYF